MAVATAGDHHGREGHGPRRRRVQRARACRPSTAHLGDRAHPLLDPGRPRDWHNAQPVYRSVGRVRVRPRAQRQPHQHRRARPSGPGCSPGVIASRQRRRRRAARDWRDGGCRDARRRSSWQAHRGGPPTLRGRSRFVLVDASATSTAIRDPHGFRPLCLGRLGPRRRARRLGARLGVARARRRSGATFVREIEPGEMVDDRRRGRALAPAVPPSASRPPSCASSSSCTSRDPTPGCTAARCTAARRRMGELLAAAGARRGRHGDGRPRLGRAGGRGLRARERHPLRPGPGEEPLHRADVHRARPAGARSTAVRRKLNPLRENIAGKRLVVVDDSIVRGTTTRAIVRHAARGGRHRGAPAHLVAAVPVALLLRHRHPDARRAAGRRHVDRPRSRATSASTRSPTSPWST